MNIKDLHIHVHTSDGREILHELHNLKTFIMANFEQWTATFEEMKAGLANISADITRLTDSI